MTRLPAAERINGFPQSHRQQDSQEMHIWNTQSNKTKEGFLAKAQAWLTSPRRTTLTTTPATKSIKQKASCKQKLQHKIAIEKLPTKNMTKIGMVVGAPAYLLTNKTKLQTEETFEH